MDGTPSAFRKRNKVVGQRFVVYSEVSLIHPVHQRVYLVLPVAVVASFTEVITLLPETTTRVGEFERPQKFVGLLEVRSDGVDFMDQVLHAQNTKLAQLVFDDAVGCDWDTLSVEFGKAPLVDQLPDCFEVRVPEVQKKRKLRN